MTAPAHAAARAPADFTRVEGMLQRFVDNEVLPGVALAVLVDGELVHTSCHGWADMEERTPLRPDHIFRVFSNTKLVTACAALLLEEEGKLDLDEPVARHLPVLAGLRVLRPDARHLHDTEPAERAITARHLLTHTAGFSYARTRPGTLLGDAYEERAVLLDYHQTLEGFVERLAGLPLMFQPGTRWEYSVGTDVLARLVEVVGGRPFARFVDERIFGPLGMVDTVFSVPANAAARVVTLYRSQFPDRPLRGGLERCDDIPYRGAYLEPAVLCSGGGGLVSTLGDMTALVRNLASPGQALLSPASLRRLFENQLPAGMPMSFPKTGVIAGRGFSFAGAVTQARSFLDPAGSEGEIQWGGIAGTHWWISPGTNSAVVLMTQRYMSFWHYFAFQIRREIYTALLNAA
jgi:CubicO group peptidase (beta-lactamase class C family)